MTRKISALTARTQFGQTMERAVSLQERFLVDRRGQPAVVIMSVEDFVKTIAPEEKAAKASRGRAERLGIDHFSMEVIDAEIAAHRRAKRRNTGQR